jgi:hypothetical protein
MLEKCRAGQWSVDDLDWSCPRPDLSPARERIVVQAFTNMAGIEKLAGALFAVQRDNVDDPVLKEILETFVVDEDRHSVAAQRLANHYDRRRLALYRPDPALVRFTPVFREVVRQVPPDVATTYVIVGELVLDIALLRSLDDFVSDEMSGQAMRLINRDEARHIAIDFHMVEHYCTAAYREELGRSGELSRRKQLWHALQVVRLLGCAEPFIQSVFFQPMEDLDPSRRRMREAFKRVQLVGQRPDIANRPFSRLILNLFRLYNTPILGAIAGPVIASVIGIDPELIQTLYSPEEGRVASEMSFDEHCDLALQAKYAF